MIENTPERDKMITFLLNRAYPRKKNGTRSVGSTEFYDELRDQPNNVLQVLFQSAKDEHARRQQARKA